MLRREGEATRSIARANSLSNSATAASIRRMNSVRARRAARAAPVWYPCRSALRFPARAPEPAAPPCMRQRVLP